MREGELGFAEVVAGCGGGAGDGLGVGFWGVGGGWGTGGYVPGSGLPLGTSSATTRCSGLGSLRTRSQPVTRGEVPDVTMAQGWAPRFSESRRGRAPGISTASSPYFSGINPSACLMSGVGG